MRQPEEVQKSHAGRGVDGGFPAARGQPFHK